MQEQSEETKHVCNSECVHFQSDEDWNYDGFCRYLKKIISFELEEKCRYFGKEQTLKLW